MEYYSASNRMDVWTPAMTWVNLQDTLLVKEASHRRMDAVRFHCQEASREVTPRETESTTAVPGAGETRGRRRALPRTSSAGEDAKPWSGPWGLLHQFT